MVQLILSKATNIFMFILLYELKALRRLVQLVMTWIFLQGLAMSKVTPMKFMKPWSIA